MNLVEKQNPIVLFSSCGSKIRFKTPVQNSKIHWRCKTWTLYVIGKGKKIV